VVKRAIVADANRGRTRGELGWHVEACRRNVMRRDRSCWNVHRWEVLGRQVPRWQALRRIVASRVAVPSDTRPWDRHRRDRHGWDRHGWDGRRGYMHRREMNGRDRESRPASPLRNLSRRRGDGHAERSESRNQQVRSRKNLLQLRHSPFGTQTLFFESNANRRSGE